MVRIEKKLGRSRHGHCPLEVNAGTPGMCILSRAMPLTTFHFSQEPCRASLLLLKDSALGVSVAARLNAGGANNFQGNVMNRVRVALFNDRAAADPVRQLLLQAGIPAEIHEELGLARLWFVSKHLRAWVSKCPDGSRARPKSFCSTGTAPMAHCAPRFIVQTAGLCGWTIRRSRTSPFALICSSASLPGSD